MTFAVALELFVTAYVQEHIQIAVASAGLARVALSL
jgi:hypothetical protein